MGTELGLMYILLDACVEESNQYENMVTDDVLDLPACAAALASWHSATVVSAVDQSAILIIGVAP